MARRRLLAVPHLTLAIGFVATLTAGLLVAMQEARPAASIGLAFLLGAVFLPLTLRLRLQGWLALLLLSATTPRFFVETVGLPSLLAFAQYPLVLLFALATLREHTRNEAGRNLLRQPVRWLLAFVAISAVSFGANPTHPLRLVTFLVILGTPLLIVATVQFWSLGPKSLTNLSRLVIVLLLVQFPVGLWQGVTIGWHDHIQGTLAGHGAGAHVLGGLLALGSFVAYATHRHRFLPLGPVVIFMTSSFLLMIAANATQVILAAAVALLVSSLLDRSRDTKRARAFATKLSALAVCGVGVALTHQLMPGIGFRIASLLSPSSLPELQVISMLREKGLLPLLVGIGPGQGGSRANLLLTPQMLTERSPLAFLDMEATPFGQELVSRSLVATAGGSAEAFASSVVSILSELGVLGGAAFLLLALRLWRATGQNPSWVSVGARQGMVLVGVLMFVDTWLEYPEFSTPLAVLIAVSLRLGTASHRKGKSVRPNGSTTNEFRGHPSRLGR